jgi:peptidylprolyl isomerase
MARCASGCSRRSRCSAGTRSRGGVDAAPRGDGAGRYRDPVLIHKNRLFLVVASSLMVAALAACGSDGSKASTDDTSSTSAPAAAASAKGKPCVAVSDTLPAGAPEVPVQVGAAPTELVVEDITPGTGTEVTASSTVVADYVGVSCSTGKIFDASYGSQPATFSLAEVIPGWQQGLVGMKVGGTRLLGIPSDMAYGPSGRDPIAPDEALWFVVELRDVQG